MREPTVDRILEEWPAEEAASEEEGDLEEADHQGR
jgi:hypothetical protein